MKILQLREVKQDPDKFEKELASLIQKHLVKERLLSGYFHVWFCVRKEEEAKVRVGCSYITEFLEIPHE